MRAVDWMEDGGRLDCSDFRDRLAVANGKQMVL